MIKNPFIIGYQDMANEDFCPRDEGNEFVTRLKTSSNNLYISEQRRIGKTAFVVNTVRNSDFIGVRINVNKCSSILDLVKHLIYLDETYSMSTPQKGKFLELGRRFQESNQEDPTVIDHYLGYALNQIQKTKTANKSPVLILDEFQNIKRFKDPEADKKLREHIIKLWDLRVVFVGSIRNEMNELFTTEGKWFYKQAIHFSLDVIPEDQFFNFVGHRLKKMKMSIPRDVFSSLYAEVRGLTEDVQLILSEMFLLAILHGERVFSRQLYDETINKMVAKEHSYFSDLIADLTPIQNEVLEVISLAPSTMPDKILKSSPLLTRQVHVTDALKSFVKKKILTVYPSDGSYRFHNPLMRIWLERHFRKGRA
ncbi:hypothetical protein WDW86_07145 [Bdellovibrionota bacterium FG-2]